MFRQIRFLLSWALVGLLWNSTAALAAPELTLSSATGSTSGGVVNITAGYVSDNAVISMDFQIQYDPTKVTPGTSIQAAGFPNSVGTNINTPGTLVVIVSPVVPTTPPIPVVPSASPFVTIPFTLAAGIADKTVIPLKLMNVTMGDAKGVAVTPSKLTDGSITVSASAVQPGDATGDGKIDLKDIMATVGAYLNGTMPQGNADCNGDGKTDLKDVMCVVTKYLSL